MNRRLIFLISMIALVVSAACAPRPMLPGGQVASPTKATPVPHRVLVSGDSILIQAYMFGNPDAEGHPAGEWADGPDTIGIGWRSLRALPGVQAQVIDPLRSPDVLVHEFGQNYINTGFNQDDQNESLTLVGAPSPGSCTVMVKPWYDGTNTTHRSVINRYRTWVDQVHAAIPGRTAVVDIGDAVRGSLTTDGVHLRTDDKATALRIFDVISTGVSECLAK